MPELYKIVATAAEETDEKKAAAVILRPLVEKQQRRRERGARVILVPKCGGGRGEEKDVEKNAIEDGHAQTGADRATRHTPARPRACVCVWCRPRERADTVISAPPCGFQDEHEPESGVLRRASTGQQRNQKKRTEKRSKV